MTTRKVTALRAEADQLCDDADRLASEDAWLLYSRAGRLRDQAHLLDEAEFDRKLARMSAKTETTT